VSIRSLRRWGLAVLLPVLALGVLAAAATGLPATIKWHFFQKGEKFSLTDSSGHPVTNPNAPPAVGDVFYSTDRDYLGNHKHHARSYLATDHIRCVITRTPTAGNPTAGARCDAQLAIGGSMLLADQVAATLTQNSTLVPINGGTGKYKGYTGIAKSVSVSNTANDLTVSVHR
jgi:hypothetical protein